MVAMRVARKTLDVGDRIVRSGAGAKGGSADIDGVGTVDDCFDTEVRVPGRGKELKASVAFRRACPRLSHGGILYACGVA